MAIRGLPSGYVKIAIENDHSNTVMDFPIENGEFSRLSVEVPDGISVCNRNHRYCSWLVAGVSSCF